MRRQRRLERNPRRKRRSAAPGAVHRQLGAVVHGRRGPTLGQRHQRRGRRDVHDGKAGRSARLGPAQRPAAPAWYLLNRRRGGERQDRLTFVADDRRGHFPARLGAAAVGQSMGAPLQLKTTTVFLASPCVCV